MGPIGGIAIGVGVAGAVAAGGYFLLRKPAPAQPALTRAAPIHGQNVAPPTPPPATPTQNSGFLGQALAIGGQLGGLANGISGVIGQLNF